MIAKAKGCDEKGKAAADEKGKRPPMPPPRQGAPSRSQPTSRKAR